MSPPARCCSELRRVAAAPVDGGQDDGGPGERGPHVRPGRQEGVHRPQVQCRAVQCSTVQYSNSTLCPGVSPGSSTSRCPASTRAPSTTASPGTPPGLCCQTASSSRSDVTVNNNSAEENNGETFIEIKVVCVVCVRCERRRRSKQVTVDIREHRHIQTAELGRARGLRTSQYNCLHCYRTRRPGVGGRGLARTVSRWWGWAAWAGWTSPQERPGAASWAPCSCS